MSEKKIKGKGVKIEDLPYEEALKYEIAKEIGVLDKVTKEGWRALSAKETGKIGGIMASRVRQDMENRN